MTYTYKTAGTCSSNIELEVEDGILKEVAFWGGCNGNLQGISRLVKGMPVCDVINVWKVSVVVDVLPRARISCVRHCTKWDIECGGIKI